MASVAFDRRMIVEAGRRRLRPTLGVILGMACVSFAGCAVPAPVEVPDISESRDLPEELRHWSSRPQALLERSLEATRALPAYTTTFQRQERLGLLKQLRPKETMRAEHRFEPFSVRFTWLDADSEFAQCVYVRGANDDKVLLMPRGGLLGEPPKVQAYPPAFAVLFQKARNPITDFGPRRMIERTLDRIARARKVGEVRLAVRGLALVGPSREPCVHVELRYPKGDPFPCKLQDLFIHSATFMPVASYLWLPGKVERCQQTLDGMYVYSNVTAAPTLGDEAFVLDPVARESKGAMGTRQADLRRRRARSQGLAATPPTAGHRSARRATLEDTGSRE